DQEVASIDGHDKVIREYRRWNNRFIAVALQRGMRYGVVILFAAPSAYAQDTFEIQVYDAAATSRSRARSSGSRCGGRSECGSDASSSRSTASCPPCQRASS